MAIYFLDNDQQLIKIVPDNGAISILQTQELPEDNSLLKDILSVHLKNDERLFDAQYMAIKSYDGNRNSFDMYRIVNELVPDNATEFEGVQVAPYELEGVVVEDLRPQRWTVERTVNQVLKDSDWRLGYIEDNLPTVSTNFYYLSAKDSLKKLQEISGVEFTFKVEISGNEITDKWVEVYQKLGNRTLKRFNYGTNALTVKRETSHSELYTALIGRGKGEEVGETEAGDATYGRKINFADVEWKKSAGKPVDKPKNQKYIELPQATSEFGVKMLDGRKVPRIGLVEFPETEDPEILINQTWQALQEYARPKVLFSATVANIGDTGIGDTVTIHRHDLNMHYKTRVRKVMRNRKNNDKTQVEIGDVVYTASTKRQANINSQLDNMQNDLSNVKGEVSHVVTSADGKNNITYSNTEPERKKVGDSWVRDHPSLAGETQWLVWNGEAWELILDTSETTLNKEAIEQAQQDIVEAKETADEAVNRINGEIAGKFTDIDTEINQVHQDAQNALNQAGEAVSQVAYFDERLDGFTQTVANIDGRVVNIRHDVDGITQTVTDHTGKIAMVEQNVNGIQQTVSDPVNGLVTQVSTLASGFNVLAKDFEDMEIGGRNYAKGTSRDFSYVSVGEYSGDLTSAGATSQHIYTLEELGVKAGDTMTVSMYVGESEEGYGGGFRIDDQSVYNRYSTQEVVKNGYAIVTFTILEGTTEIRLYTTNRRTSGASASFELPIKELKLEKGTVATDWTPAPEDMATQAQLSVLNDNINLRVEKGDVLGQINIEAGTTLIQNDKLYLDAQTVAFSGNAFIPGAVIEDLSADKINAGTLNGNQVRVINLDFDTAVGNRTEFVQSAWNNAVGGNVSISGSGIVTTASSGAQGLIQNGVFLSRRPNGSTLGYIGYGQESSSGSPYYTINLSNGAHFRVRNHLGSENYQTTFHINSSAEYAEFNVNRVHYRNQISIRHPGHFIEGTTYDKLTINGSSSITLAASNQTVFVISASSGTGYASMYTNLDMKGYHIKNAGSYGTRSERKYKSNIIPIENAIEAVEQMNFYDYEKDGIQELGIMADEAPDCVLDEDKKTVNIYSYASLIGKSNQELIQRVKELEIEVAELKGMIA